MSRWPWVLVLFVAGRAVAHGGPAGSAPQQTPADGALDPASLEKYVDPLPPLATVQGFTEDGTVRRLTIGMWEIEQKLHRDLPPTRLYAYGETRETAAYPGPTIVARRGAPLEIEWQNHLPDAHFLPVDDTIHRAMPLGPGVPTTVHVHGGMQEGPSDGHPDAWFTRDFAETGPGWVKRVSRYENQNEYEPLWYHDHALGLTRLNVYAGLAGFYRLRDPEAERGLPSGEFDRELLLQDRSFDEDGSLSYPDQGVTSAHPVWNPEFFGDVNLVNGVVWPFLEVEPRRYRLLLLNGANARFYDLSLSNGLEFTIVGSDGGLLGAPVSANTLLLGPGERAEVVVDFSGLAPGTTLELVNDANAPFPGGDPVDEHTSKVMQFRVVAPRGADDSAVPATLGTIPDLGPPSRTRSLTLVEVEDDATGNPLGVFLDGKRWGDPGDVSEIGRLGETEVWELVNLTDDAHPIHLHLVDFQVMERQPFDADGYRTRFEELNPSLPSQQITGLDVAPFLQPGVTEPEPAERGWKDTVHAYPGMVTRLKVRWAPELGGSFPFDATAAPGYVWHCHILEHEDNEMMRRFELVR